MRTRPVPFFVLLAAAASSSCAEGFDEHAAFESEAYLCGTPEWDDLVSRCREDFDDDESCHGVTSYEGELQGQRVVVASRLTRSELGEVVRLDSARDRHDIAMSGLSPYFEFELQIGDIGGDVNLGEVTRAFTIGAPVDPDFPLDDDRVEGALRIASGLSSRDQNFRDGTVIITNQLEHEMIGSFDAFTFANDRVYGCFVVFDATPSVAVEAP